MDIQINPDDRTDEEGPGPWERVLLAAVRLASLPFLLLAIVLVALIYGIAILGQGIMMIGRLSSPWEMARNWDRPAKAQDA